MFKIVDWVDLYEVNDRGDPAKPGESLRRKPLDYIRLRNHGRAVGLGFRRMQSLTRDKRLTWDTFGKFCKLLEIAGAAPGSQRGMLLNEKGLPASVEDLAFLFDVPVDDMQFTMDVLCDPLVHWVHNNGQSPSPVNNSEVPNSSGNLRKFTGNPEDSGKSPETEKKTTNRYEPQKQARNGVSRESPENLRKARKTREKICRLNNRTEVKLNRIKESSNVKPSIKKHSSFQSLSDRNKNQTGEKIGSARPETRLSLICQKFALAATEIINKRWPRKHEQIEMDAQDLVSLARHVACECPDSERLKDQLDKLLELLREKAACPRLNPGSFFAAAMKRFPSWRKRKK